MDKNNGIVQHDVNTTANRLSEACSLGLAWFTGYIFDIGHPCCDWLTLVKNWSKQGIY